MWLDNLKDLKKAKGMTAKQIAALTNLPERTVARIFSGDTDNPYMDTVHRIVTVLGGSLDDVFVDTKAVVATENLVEVKETVDTVTAERDRIIAERDLILAERDLALAENATLKAQVAALTSENELLRLKLSHKEEIIALHNYYIKRDNV